MLITRTITHIYILTFNHNWDYYYLIFVCIIVSINSDYYTNNGMKGLRGCSNSYETWMAWWYWGWSDGLGMLWWCWSPFLNSWMTYNKMSYSQLSVSLYVYGGVRGTLNDGTTKYLWIIHYLKLLFKRSSTSMQQKQKQIFW